jgi:hypothetical protein
VEAVRRSTVVRWVEVGPDGLQHFAQVKLEHTRKMSVSVSFVTKQQGDQMSL